ncbi:MAG: murein biosynthesis integral membrane protein MurJ, partial [Proteobacteria bacterium]|nr:murein biosynthesis integral membrane protein MurJ [Pseudomonadota bacterium]
MVLLRSIATVGGFTLISRVLGFLRDILIAAVLGAGAGADAFFVAFKLPNLFRRLFAEGAFSMAFVPLFAGRLEEKGKAEAQAFAEAAFSVLLWTLLVFVIVIELAMPWIMVGFAPGFVGDKAKFDLAVTLTRITFPYLLLISLVSLMAGVLNSLGRFAAAAATPILLNLCLIGAILGLARVTETPSHALAWGVAAAGVFQFIWLFMACGREGVRLRLVPPRLTADVRALIRRIVPVAIGAGVYQVNLVIDTIIASLLPTGSIAYLFYADRVNQLPLGVVGVAVGTALL